eukprot:TRINITY_DN2943_c0_g2_i2.p2 TRINITY_DN2943_c0_g2~~TRINITY_DN2943_c0_g2_i2.p2  ORF type:complete len:591 (-),score=162.80 TRINITY_DN2943_c0_g2_i2:2759-4531(-)
MEWLLWSVPETSRISFEANVGNKLIVLQVDFEKGENAEIKMNSIFERESFPLPLRISLLSSLHSLFLIDLQSCIQESNAFQDSQMVLENALSIQQEIQSSHLQWKPKEDQIKEEKEETSFSMAYQYLISLTSSSVQDTLRQLEISYIRAILDVQEKSEKALNVLRTRQSEEMEKASTKITDPSKISMIVAKHVEEVEKMEAKWNKELNLLKKKQRREYHEFVINFYKIESQRLLDPSERANFMNLVNYAPSLPSSLTQSIDTPPSSSSPSSSRSAVSNSPSVTMEDKVNKLLKNSQALTRKPSNLVSKLLRKKQESIPTVRSADVAIPTALVTALPEDVTREISETFMITCPPLLYSLRVTSLPLFEVGRAALGDEDDFVPPLLASLGGSVYGESLAAIILLVDPSLSYKSKNGKEFLRLCKVTTDFHFPSFEEQLNGITEDLKKRGKVLKEGDFFITKHSNLGGINVVFHLIIEHKKNLLNDPPLNSDSPLIKSIENVFSVAVQYDIEVLLFPLLFVEPQTLQEESSITVESEAFKRATVVLDLILKFLEDRLTEDFKSIVVTLPMGKNTDSLQKTTKEIIKNRFQLVG